MSSPYLCEKTSIRFETHLGQTEYNIPHSTLTLLVLGLLTERFLEEGMSHPYNATLFRYGCIVGFILHSTVRIGGIRVLYIVVP